MYRIRTALGRTCIGGDRETLRVDPDVLRTDVRVFETLLDRGDLEEGVELYRGPFLDGFHLRGSKEFEDWRSAEALRLGQRYEAALEALAETFGISGDLRRSAGYWRRLSAYDPLNTFFALGRMKAMAGIGDPGNAIQVGEEHVRLLEEELGAVAPPELTALLESFRAGGQDAGSVEEADGDWRSLGASLGGGRGSANSARVGRVAALPPAVPEDARTCIAVLPCENLSLRPEDALYAEMLHDAIITRLQIVSSIAPTGRSSVLWYRDHPTPPARIARELNVSYLGECGFLKEKDRIRVTFRLVEAMSGRQVWSESFDAVLVEAAGVIDMLSDIAERVVRGLGAKLTRAEQARIWARPTGNLSAYELYLVGRNRFSQFSAEKSREAIDCFEAAIGEDTTFALAYAGLGIALTLLPLADLSLDTVDVRERARAAVTRALALDPSSGEVHASRALFLHFLEWDWAGAELHYRNAVRLIPGDVFLHQWYASLLSALGRVEEGVEKSRLALAMDPQASRAIWPSGDRLVQAGRLGEARLVFERAVRMEPPVPWAFLHLGAYVYAQEEPADLDKASDMISRFLTFFGYPHPQRVAPLVEAIAGNRDLCREATAVLEDIVDRTILERADIFWCYARVAPKDLFFELVEEAVSKRHMWVPWIPVMVGRSVPELIEDPRWAEFLEKIRYPGTAIR